MQLQKHLALLFISSTLLCLTQLLYSCETVVNPDDTAIVSSNNSTPRPKTTAYKGVLEPFEQGACSESQVDFIYTAKNVRPEDPVLFTHSMIGGGCIQVNGELHPLINRDFTHQEYVYSSSIYTQNNKYWIVAQPNKPVLYFGKPLPEYHTAVECLAHVLVALDELPTAIPIQDKTGNTDNKLEELAIAAIERAKVIKGMRDYSYFEEELYYNDAYQVVIDMQQKDELGKPVIHDATLTLKDAEGNVLQKQAVKGTFVQ